MKSTSPLRVLNIILRKCNKINAHNSVYSAAQEVEQPNALVVQWLTLLYFPGCAARKVPCGYLKSQKHQELEI